MYDNCEDVGLLRELLPVGGTGAIIVTSQNPAFSHLTKNSIHLQPMSTDEGSSLIQNYLNRGGSEKDEAEHLSASLGGLPLAIVHFVGYIARSQCPIQQINQSLVRILRSSQTWTMTDTGIPSATRAYQHTLGTVWDLALNRLSEDARTLLEFIAFLDADQIPTAILLRKN